MDGKKFHFESCPKSKRVRSLAGCAEGNWGSNGGKGCLARTSALDAGMPLKTPTCPRTVPENPSSGIACDRSPSLHDRQQIGRKLSGDKINVLRCAGLAAERDGNCVCGWLAGSIAEAIE